MSIEPNPDYSRPMTAADWNGLVPWDQMSVFTEMITFFHHEDAGVDYGTVKKALAEGAILSPPGQKGVHALILAVWLRDLELLKLLVDHGFDPNELSRPEPGDDADTALDAVADDFHVVEDREIPVLEAMERYLLSVGACYGRMV